MLGILLEEGRDEAEGLLHLAEGLGPCVLSGDGRGEGADGDECRGDEGLDVHVVSPMQRVRAGLASGLCERRGKEPRGMAVLSPEAARCG